MVKKLENKFNKYAPELTGKGSLGGTVYDFSGGLTESPVGEFTAYTLNPAEEVKISRGQEIIKRILLPEEEVIKMVDDKKYFDNFKQQFINHLENDLNLIRYTFVRPDGKTILRKVEDGRFEIRAIGYRK